MLDKLIGGIGGFRHGYGNKDYRTDGYGFEEHKEFVSHVESERGYFDRQARYDHRMRLPANHGRPPMSHMPVCDEEDSDVEEFFESSRSHHTTALPHHSNNHHHIQPPHLNFMPPSPVVQPHHNGKMGNGWQGQHEDAYHGGYGIQHHGEHGMQHHDMHGKQHQGGYGMQHHGGQGMMHHDRLKAPQVPPRNVFMNPIHSTGDGRAVVVKASENRRVSGGHHKAKWGSKGL